MCLCIKYIYIYKSYVYYIYIYYVYYICMHYLYLCIYIYTYYIYIYTQITRQLQGSSYPKLSQGLCSGSPLPEVSDLLRQAQTLVAGEALEVVACNGLANVARLAGESSCGPQKNQVEYCNNDNNNNNNHHHHHHHNMYVM